MARQSKIDKERLVVLGCGAFASHVRKSYLFETILNTFNFDHSFCLHVFGMSSKSECTILKTSIATSISEHFATSISNTLSVDFSNKWHVILKHTHTKAATTRSGSLQRPMISQKSTDTANLTKKKPQKNALTSFKNGVTSYTLLWMMIHDDWFELFLAISANEKVLTSVSDIFLFCLCSLLMIFRSRAWNLSCSKFSYLWMGRMNNVDYSIVRHYCYSVTQ